MHALVVGAGVVGLACATELLNRGVSVTVVDRSTTLFADACSRSAGGMLAPWCERESAEQLVLELGMQAADWWQQHVDCVVRNGTLVLAHARDAADLRRFATLVEAYEHMDGEEIGRLEPDLQGRYRHGLFFPQEAHLDPRQALEQLAAKVRARGGTLLLGTDGRSSSLSRDITIDCRGLAARDDLSELRGVRGEMLLIRTSELSLNRPVRLLHPRIPLYIVPRGDHTFMVGATMIESDERRRVSVRSVVELLSAAFSLHPGFGEAEVIELGCDVRPAFADNLPRLLRRGSTLFVNGLYRHGFLLAPALARIAARAAVDPHYGLELKHESDGERRSA